MPINEISGLLGASAIGLLSVINGVMLLRSHLRDKPKLIVKPVHPESYQWWFRLPDGEKDGNPTRKYGFLVYVGISNQGLRKVSVTSWRLIIKLQILFKKVEIKALTIPEPKIDFGENTKVLQVLGTSGPNTTGDTLVDSGCSISGMAYYVCECYGEEGWNPKIENGKIIGKFVITDVFNKKSNCEIVFSEKPLEEISKVVEGIDTIDLEKIFGDDPDPPKSD